MKLTKCPKCGGRLEHMCMTWVCMKCYAKIMPMDVADEVLARIDALSVMIHQMPSIPEGLQSLLDAPYSWSTEGEPEPDQIEAEATSKPGQEEDKDEE